MSKNYLKIMAKAFEHSRAKKEKEETPDEKVSVTKHSIRINGETLNFTATAGYMKMTDEYKKPRSNIFYVSYTKDDGVSKSERPITFAFNGGPGCASMWVHFGAMGPKKAILSEEGEVLPPPYKFEDNKHTWLQFTDLVFIDPVGTGYSRPVKDEDPKNYFGVKEDIEAVGDFIRLYITKNERWLSPKYIAGESYGTTRSAGLAGYLQEKYAMDLNGLILISSVLNYQTICFTVGNDLPYILFLPSYTATAWFHKKLCPELQENLGNTLRQVEEWALGEYCLALAKGDTLDESATQKVVAQLARFTGISETFIRKSNLRIASHRFCKELLRDENRTVGRLDSRFKGIDADSAGESPEYDPSFSKGPFIAAVGDYLRTQLKYENDIPYMPISDDVHSAWNWSDPTGQKMGFPNVAETLRKAMCSNKYLRVLIASGYYDLATPYFASLYTVSHMGLDPSLRGNISFTFYESGHMMYYHAPSLKKFTEDARNFYKVG